MQLDETATKEKLNELVVSYSDSWENNAKNNALYSILGIENGDWDKSRFFAAGNEEIDRVFGFMRDAGIELGSFGNFLDFGCGVGRNTRVLMTKFQSGLGVDISARMIAEATQYAKADRRQARYVVNQAMNLSFVADNSVDFIYCHIVLQHIPGPLQKIYVAEFLRFSRRAALRHSRFRRVPTRARRCRRSSDPCR